MNTFGKYFTNELFSRLLVNSIEFNNPKKIIDLGAGEGSLIKMASLRWTSAEFIAMDIDKNSLRSLIDKLPFVNVYNSSGLRINLEKSINICKSSIDVAICNPPYLKINDKARFNNLLVEAGLKECQHLSRLTSEIVFIAQNLRLLFKGGELGVIIPDGIATGKEFKLLRQSLLLNHNVKALIELPEKIFPKTEAKTHIMVIEKGSFTKNKIPMFIAGRNGQCYDQIDVRSSLLENRMDFAFQKLCQSSLTIGYRPLHTFPCELKRGNLSKKDGKRINCKFLHSTSFKNNDELYLINKRKNASTKLVYAEKGDLLIVRVGRRCVGKVAIVKSGRLPITDCLYVLKANSVIINNIIEFIGSSEGQNWIQGMSHGVCAKVLSRSDILSIPIKL